MSSASKHPRSCATAFTLVELLIVITIVVILIALLLPVLKSSRETARRVICGSQLHLWGVAYFNYASSSNGWLPGVTYWDLQDVQLSTQPLAPPDIEYYQNSPQWRSTSDMYAHYGLTREVTFCPSIAYLKPSDPAAGIPWAQGPMDVPHTQQWVSYFIMAGVAAHNFGSTLTPLNESSIGPFSYCGWEQGGIWEGRYGRFSENRGPVWKLASRKSLKSPLAMDQHYARKWQNKYYQYGWGLISNHPRSNPVATTGGIVGGLSITPTFAAGANALFLDGSVAWQDLMGASYDASLGDTVPAAGDANFVYGGDWYRRFYLNCRWRDP